MRGKLDAWLLNPVKKLFMSFETLSPFCMHSLDLRNNEDDKDGWQDDMV